jgi:hypothetical protein
MGSSLTPKAPNPFNSPFEAGVRVVIILVAAFPTAFDLQKLVVLDYLTVHSGDAGGPLSLHPPVPLRAGELLVRRQLVERGLLLMSSRSLVVREFLSAGIFYRATDDAGPFVDNFRSDYSVQMKARASWAANQFGALSTSELNARTAELVKNWSAEFEGPQVPGMLI